MVWAIGFDLDISSQKLLVQEEFDGFILVAFSASNQDYVETSLLLPAVMRVAASNIFMA